MKTSATWITILTVLIVAIAVAVLQSPGPTTSSNDQPVVATTIFPLYDIVQNIAGDAVNVELILPVGASPHTFEPTPSLLRDLEGASVVYAMGYGADDWSFTIAESIEAEVELVDDGIVIREFNVEEEEDGHGDEHAHGELDPHYWLTFENAILITQTIADDLAARFPESAEAFVLNTQVYLRALETARLEAQRIRTEEIENPYLITLHDAWYYFAKDLGLEIVGSFEPSAGAEPTPQYLIELSEAIEQAGTTVLYTEPQLNTQSLSSFLQDNDLSIDALDPLGGNEDRASYIDMMLSNVQTIADNQ